MRKTTACRGCGRAIIWGSTLTGGRMPLDAAPISEATPGSYQFTGAFDTIAPAAEDNAAQIYMNHWATCPKAQQFKQPAARQAELHIYERPGRSEWLPFPPRKERE